MILAKAGVGQIVRWCVHNGRNGGTSPVGWAQWFMSAAVGTGELFPDGRGHRGRQRDVSDLPRLPGGVDGFGATVLSGPTSPRRVTR